MQMSKHQHRVDEVLVFLQNRDIDLGFRKLLDCATDTQDMQIYKKAIDLTDWKSVHPNDTDTFIKKATALLKEIADVNVTEYDINQFVLKADEIKKSYGHNHFALGPISVKIRKGQVYGLVGENGNGKTTLLRILARELSFDSGDVKYNFTTEAESNYDLRTKLIYIPQRTEKWYGSLKDNLKFVLSNYNIKPTEIETRTLMIIARLGLWDYKHLKWSELSSGYKMRFELARTLLRQPEILLLDEPLANLDVVAQQIILEDLKAICNSVNNPIALILSSQQLYEVEKISDKVIFLKNGQYKDNTFSVEEEQNSQLIIELDSTTSRQELLLVFESLDLIDLKYNGGLYIAQFNKSTTLPQVLTALGNANVDLIYIRNISSSTRRFFVS